MNRIISQCLKELAQFKRDRITVALAFILPLGILLIYGFAIRLEIKNIPLSVQDFDRSPLSRTYIERLLATNQFSLVSSCLDEVCFVSPTEALDRGLAKVTVIIPPEFSRHIKANKPINVQVLVDGTDVNNGRVIQNSIRATTNFFLQTITAQTESQRVVARTRIWFNPGRKESLYIVPGIYAVILWVFPSMLTAIAIVREKEQGTIVQVYASDLSGTEWLLGKGIAYLLIAIGEALVVMTVGSLLFRISLVGDFTSLIMGTLIYLIASVSFGLFFGVRASNQNAAVQGTAILGFLTAFLLSGFIYPISNIPFPISLISNLIPARYYIILTRDVFVRGTGWQGIWYAPIAIGIIALIFFTIAARALQRMQLPD